MIRLFLKQRINLTNFHKNYKAIEKIGRGNFANVYLANNLQDDNQYAIKAFQKDIIETQSKGITSLENEIKIMRKLDNNNVIKLHEIYETKNSFYMVLDMLSGGNLLDLI